MILVAWEVWIGLLESSRLLLRNSTSLRFAGSISSVAILREHLFTSTVVMRQRLKWNYFFSVLNAALHMSIACFHFLRGIVGRLCYFLPRTMPHTIMSALCGKQCCWTFQLPHRKWNDVELFAILVKDDWLVKSWKVVFDTFCARTHRYLFTAQLRPKPTKTNQNQLNQPKPTKIN